MDLDPLRTLIRTARTNLDLTQEEAADQAGVTKDRWQNLEILGNSRRTAIRLPHDRELIDAVARTLGRDDGMSLMREAGIL